MAECIKLVKTTLQLSEEPKAHTTAFDRDLDGFIDKLGEIRLRDPFGEIEQNSRPELPRSSLTQTDAIFSKSLSILEEDLDHLLELEEREATARQGAPVFDNYLNPDDDATPVLGSHQGLMRRPTRSGRLMHWKGTKPSKLLDLSSPRSVTNSSKLPFQEGWPLASSDEVEGLTM